MDAANALVPVSSEKPADLHMALAVTNMGFTSMAALAGLGYLVFDPSKNEQVVETYHAALDWTSQDGREIHPGRLKWFLRQSGVSRKAASDEHPVGLKSAIGKLMHALAEHKPKVVWVYGTDVGQLSNLMMQNGLKLPWGDTELRDPRTALNTFRDLGMAKAVTRAEFEPEGHAIGDASYILRQVREIYAGGSNTTGGSK